MKETLKKTEEECRDLQLKVSNSSPRKEPEDLIPPKRKANSDEDRNIRRKSDEVA